MLGKPLVRFCEGQGGNLVMVHCHPPPESTLSTRPLADFRSLSEKQSPRSDAFIADAKSLGVHPVTMSAKTTEREDQLRYRERTLTSTRHVEHGLTLNAVNKSGEELLTEMGSGDEHGIDQDILIKEEERAGFMLVGRHDFVKPDDVDYFLI